VLVRCLVQTAMADVALAAADEEQAPAAGPLHKRHVRGKPSAASASFQSAETSPPWNRLNPLCPMTSLQVYRHHVDGQGFDAGMLGN
jgi:hypothetical protein